FSKVSYLAENCEYHMHHSCIEDDARRRKHWRCERDRGKQKIRWGARLLRNRVNTQQRNRPKRLRLGAESTESRERNTPCLPPCPFSTAPDVLLPPRRSRCRPR